MTPESSQDSDQLLDTGKKDEVMRWWRVGAAEESAAFAGKDKWTRDNNDGVDCGEGGRGDDDGLRAERELMYRDQLIVTMRRGTLHSRLGFCFLIMIVIAAAMLMLRGAHPGQVLVAIRMSAAGPAHRHNEDQCGQEKAQRREA